MPGLLVLRFDGPLYTANVRSANRKIADAVDQGHALEVVVVDVSAVAMLTVTVLDEVADLRRELDARGVELWVSALARRVLPVAQHAPHWSEMYEAGRIPPYDAGGDPGVPGSLTSRTMQRNPMCEVAVSTGSALPGRRAVAEAVVRARTGASHP